jgi:hypothetical protein
VTKLTKLTQAQIDAMPHYAQKWIDIGLSTERVDFEKAKGLVSKAYKAVGLEAPKAFHFAKGPDEAFETYKMLGGKKDRNFFLSGNMNGSMEATWLSYYDYYKRETSIDLKDVDYMIDLAKNCGWVYCAREIAIIQDRPMVIKFDDQKRLHCQTGPAIEYGDGFTVHAWHGVAVPGKWIRGDLTATEALRVENTEKRRAACEILGWAKILDELDSVVVDQDEDPMIGTLLEVTIEGNKEKFLKVLCGTGRTFAIPVPPEMKTAIEAQAWTYDLPLDVYGDGPEVRT